MFAEPVSVAIGIVCVGRERGGNLSHRREHIHISNSTIRYPIYGARQAHSGHGTTTVPNSVDNSGSRLYNRLETNRLRVLGAKHYREVTCGAGV
jgi:hypothetical protein